MLTYSAHIFLHEHHLVHDQEQRDRGLACHCCTAVCALLTTSRKDIELREGALDDSIAKCLWWLETALVGCGISYL